MQCNSINVVEESMMISRSGHTPEMEMSRTPQTPNSESDTHTHTRKEKLIIQLRLIVKFVCSSRTIHLEDYLSY